MSRRIDNLAVECFDLIKEFENSLLFLLEEGSNLSPYQEELALAVHYDGAENYAIGYGVDLYQNSWINLASYFDEANRNCSDNFDYDNEVELSFTNATGEEVTENHSFQDLVTNYRSSLRDNFKGSSNEERMSVLQEVMDSLKDARYDNENFTFPTNIRIEGVTYSNRANQEIYNLVSDFYNEIIAPLITFQLPSVDYAVELLNMVAEPRYTNAVTAVDREHGDYFSRLNPYQKGAIFSMVYNGGVEGLFAAHFSSPQKIRDYVEYKDSEDEKERELAVKARTRAWYELRYNSCKEAWARESTGSGLARRRYNEGDLFGLYDEDEITAQEAEWILEFFDDDSVTKRDSEYKDEPNILLTGITNIARHYENNIAAVPDEENVLGEDILGIDEIIERLENLEKAYVLYPLSDTEEDLYEKYYEEKVPTEDPITVRRYQQGKVAFICPELSGFDPSKAVKKGEQDKVYLPASKKIYERLKTLFEESYQSDYIKYLETISGNTFTRNSAGEIINREVIEEVLKAYHDEYDLSRQDNFDYFRTLGGKIKIIDLLYYLVKQCQSKEEEKEEGQFLEKLNSILNYFNKFNTDESATYADNEEKLQEWSKIDLGIQKIQEGEEGKDLKKDNRAYQILKTFEKDDYHRQLYGYSSEDDLPLETAPAKEEQEYINVIELIERLLIKLLSIQKQSKIDTLAGKYISCYHRSSKLVLFPQNTGFFNTIMELKEIRVIPLLEKIVQNTNRWHSPALKALNSYLKEIIEGKDYDYRTYLDENFIPTEQQDILDEDKEKAEELITKFNQLTEDYSGIIDFLNIIKETEFNKNIDVDTTFGDIFTILSLSNSNKISKNIGQTLSKILEKDWKQVLTDYKQRLSGKARAQEEISAVKEDILEEGIKTEEEDIKRFQRKLRLIFSRYQTEQENKWTYLKEIDGDREKTVKCILKMIQDGEIPLGEEAIFSKEVEDQLKEKVKAIQRDLQGLGYYTGEVDGEIDPEVKDSANIVTAVKEFQEGNELTVDGIVGPASREKIEEEISWVQEKLLALEYQGHTTSAVYDQATKESMKKFQEDMQEEKGEECELEATGYVNGETRGLLEGASGDEGIKTLQTRLKIVNMYNGKIDGIRGPLTNNAENKYKTNKGKEKLEKIQENLKRIGFYDEEIGEEYISETAEAVKAIKEKYHFTDLNGDAECNISGRTKALFKEEVKSIQVMLMHSGYYKREKGIDGIYGTGTKDAVKDYQKAKSLTINREGYIDEKTRNKLEKDFRAKVGEWQLPVKDPDGIRTNSTYVGEYASRYGEHKGIDILGERGVTEIYPAKKGKVVSINRDHKTYGNFIYIDHGNGMVSRYCHLDSIDEGITWNKEIKKRDPIGKMGNTGNAGNTPTHLHFEIREQKVISRNHTNSNEVPINLSIYIPELDSLQRKNKEKDK